MFAYCVLLELGVVVFLVLEIEPKALRMLSTHSTPELRPPPLGYGLFLPFYFKTKKTTTKKANTLLLVVLLGEL